MKRKLHPENKNEFVFLPLGGCGEIGMNLNLYGYGGKWLMVDLGVTFTHELGIEVMMPDPSFIEERKSDLVGLVLTHAHEDHIGAVPYLWDRLRCPIYATPFTAFLVREKLREAGLSKVAKVQEIGLGGSVDLAPFKVTYITLTHSIPEPNALAIETPAGVVIHTGDWKIDDAPMVGDVTDVEALKKWGDRGVLALVCDSTNVFVKGRTGSEESVRKELIRVVRKQKNRVVVACFASNVARLQSAAIAAHEAGRKVALVGRSLYRMEEAARSCGYLKGLPPFLHEEDIRKIPPEEILLICTGSQGEPRSALARIASGQHPRVRLEEGDTVIFSSRVIPGNEHEIRDLQDQLIESGQIVINAHDEDIHVSGHPSREDLKMMYDWIRPEMIVPVHGEKAHIREHARFAEKCGIRHSVQPHNGLMIALNPDNPGIIQEVPAGRLALDGNVVVPRSNIQLRDRHRLMESGIIFITLLLGKKGDLKKDPEVSLIGVVEEGGESKMAEVLQNHVEEMIMEAPREIRTDSEAVKELVRIGVRRLIHAKRGKKPTVITHVTGI